MFLDKICDTPNKSILLGDFNLHLDQPDKSDTNRFCTALENSGPGGGTRLWLGRGCAARRLGTLTHV